MWWYWLIFVVIIYYLLGKPKKRGQYLLRFMRFIAFFASFVFAGYFLLTKEVTSIARGYYLVSCILLVIVSLICFVYYMIGEKK